MKKVIIIEDDRQLGRILKEVFKNLKFDALLLRNAEEFFENAEREKPDLIVTDYLLPGINGIEILIKLRANSEHKKTPVVVLSGIDSTELMDECLAKGAAAFLQKPFKLKTLIKVINDLNPEE